MTVTLALAVLLQLAALAALRCRLGRTWLRRPSVLLVVASCIYDGVAPLLLDIPAIGQRDNFRQGITSRFVDEGALLLSGGMLAFAFCYLLTRPERAEENGRQGDLEIAARSLDWRLLGAACVPLAIATYAGRGYNDARPSAGSETALSSNLASAFFITLVLLAALGFLMRHGTRWIIPVLAVQSGVLAAAGERSPVIIDAVALGVLLAVTGHRPSRRQVIGALGLTLLAILAITGLRAEQGRSVFYRDSGFSGRLSALASGLAGAVTLSNPSSNSDPGLVTQAAVRLDGTSFAGGILQARQLGQPGMSVSGVPRSLLLAIPSAVWASKLDHAGLDVYQAQISNFGLQRINFLPGFAGLYAGMLSMPWLLAFLGACGALAGLGEMWLLRTCSPTRLVLLAGAVTMALWYERGLPQMVVSFRAAVVLALAVKVVHVVAAKMATRQVVAKVR